MVLTTEIDINALQGNGFEGQAALHMAASRGNIGMVNALIAHGAGINLFNQALEGCSQPLHIAAFHAHTDIVKLLLDSGAERDAKGQLEEKALFQVLLHKSWVTPKHVETITLLLDYDFDVNDADVVTPQATSRAHLPLVQLLLDRGACLSPTVLSDAAGYGNYEIVELLLEKGANVSGPALLGAAAAGKVDSFKLLLSHADKDMLSKNFDALHNAASSGHTSLVELMLDEGFEIEAKDQCCSNTPLHSVCVASGAWPGVVRLLLSRGATISARNIHVVAWRSDPEVVKLLLQAGADTDARNHEDQTPLMALASQITGVTLDSFHAHGRGLNPRLEAFKFLLTARPDVTTKDLHGRTVSHELVVHIGSTYSLQTQLNAVILLLQIGVNVWAVDEEGTTASELFPHCRHPKLAQLLGDVHAGPGTLFQRELVDIGESMIKGRVGRKRIVKL